MPGAIDAQGVWQYAEDDLVANPTWSAYMNKLAKSVSDRFDLDDDRLDALELLLSGVVFPFRFAAGRHVMSSAVWTTINFPAGRFTQPPVVTISPMSAGAYSAQAHNVTTTNFQGGVVVTNTGNLIASSFQWIAVQMTPTSAVG